MQRYQRRRAGGVDGHVRPVYAENVRNPAARHAAGDTGGEIGVVARKIVIAIGDLRVFVAGQSHEDAGSGSGQVARSLPGVLQRLPGHFQQEPLLRVHGNRFPRRYSEKLRIKPVHSVEKPSPARGHLSRRIRIRVIVVVDFPAGFGHFGNRVAPLPQELPELHRAVSAGEAASHAYNRDWFVAASLRRGQAPLHVFQGQQRLLERRKLRGADWARIPVLHRPLHGRPCAAGLCELMTSSNSAAMDSGNLDWTTCGKK